MLVSESRRQKHWELELQADDAVNPELFIVHDERCSKTEKHAPSQAGRRGLKFRDMGNYMSQSW